jgi:hypothetical protein
MSFKCAKAPFRQDVEGRDYIADVDQRLSTLRTQRSSLEGFARNIDGYTAGQSRFRAPTWVAGTSRVQHCTKKLQRYPTYDDAYRETNGRMTCPPVSCPRQTEDWYRETQQVADSSLTMVTSLCL